MIEERVAADAELTRLLSIDEDHFTDLKGKDIQPAKLQETFVAFANADGGELYVGVEDKKYTGDRIRPFLTKEDANAILAVLLEQTTPSVENVGIEFLVVPQRGYLLHLSIPKSTKVHYASSGDCYLRLNASKVKLKGERVTQLAYSKGAAPYERIAVESVGAEEMIESEILQDYMARISTSLDPNKFLKKQRLLTEKNGKLMPNVGCVLLFDEEPQASIETRCAIKVYRLRTTEAEYKREHLVGMPKTVKDALNKRALSAANPSTSTLLS